MTVTTPKRLGALAFAAMFAIGACSSGGSSTAPSTAASAPASTAASAPPASAPAAGVSGTINVSGSSTVEPISTGDRRGASRPRTRTSTTRSPVPAPATASRRFCAGETDISDASRKIKAEEAGRPAPPPASSTSSCRSPIDGITVMTSPDNSAVDCLSFADLYALIGPESTGFKKWTDAAGARQGARLEHDLPRCRPRRSPARARSPAPTTASSRSRSPRSPTAAQAGPTKTRDPPGLHRERQRQRDHRGHRRIAELARLGRLRLRRGERGQGQGARRRQGPERHLRRRRPRRRSPTAPTRSRGPCTSTSTRPRRPRTRP